MPSITIKIPKKILILLLKGFIVILVIIIILTTIIRKHQVYLTIINPKSHLNSIHLLHQQLLNQQVHP